MTDIKDPIRKWEMEPLEDPVDPGEGLPAVPLKEPEPVEPDAVPAE